MKAHEIRKMSVEELQKRILEEKENLSNLRFQKVMGQLENPMKIGHIRKDIARMNTILRERELQPNAQPAPAETNA